MLLAPEQSATSIHDDHLSIHSDTPRRVRDECVFGVSLTRDVSAGDEASRYKAEIFFHEGSVEGPVLTIEHVSTDWQELVRYSERVALHAARNVNEFVSTEGSLRLGEVIFVDGGLEFIADGASHSVDHDHVAAIDAVDGKTLVWRTGELEPFAVIEATDPCASVVRERLRSAVPSSTQQTDWIAADEDFFQMVGPIECHPRSLAPSYSALRSGTIALACVLAAMAWWAVPEYAIYISGLLALAVTAGTVVLTNQANQSGLILAVFRRGVTLMSASSEDLMISWLDITDAKLETQTVTKKDQERRETVSLELTTSAEIGRVIRLGWDARSSDHLALSYLHEQLDRRIWKPAKHGKAKRR